MATAVTDFVITRATLSDQIYDHLRSEMLAGELACARVKILTLNTCAVSSPRWNNQLKSPITSNSTSKFTA